jgi:putative flippase GtrA
LTDISAGFYIDLFAVTAFVIAVTNSFFWNKYWAFEERKSETFKEEAIKFFIISSAVAFINISIIHVTVNVIGAPAGTDPKIWANVALVFAIVVAFLGNFFGYKYIVFKK